MPSTDLAWKDVLNYGTEQDYSGYLLKIGEMQQDVAQDSEKEERAGDCAMHDWMEHIDVFLQTLIGLEGRNNHNKCTTCGSTEEELYQCLTCDYGDLRCQSCTVQEHQRNPLHRIRKWNGRFFEKSSLKKLGLRIQLGHGPGESCMFPIKATNDDFVVIDHDQVHEVGLDFCGCGMTTKSQPVQLLERRLYPATTLMPKTAATFRALEMFELLQYEAKVSVFEFYQTIIRLTDNTGLNEPKNRYVAMLRMTHEWRHLKLLKRAGRGHDPFGSAQDAQEGECAVLCPACPHPGINMPVGWEDDPDDKQYLHCLNLAMDACFRLKRKDTSGDKADPGLSHGFAYFVEEKKFKSYLAEHASEVEPKSTCSRHDAVNSADTRPGQGYAATGVATVECARHNMKRPLGVGDLQRGEHYCNIDYLLYQSLKDTKLKAFLLSYDICCQWSLNLFKRLEKIDSSFRLLDSNATCRFVVPKFHLPAHILACRTQYAFMHTPGAGLGDGEAPERGWGNSNPLATSTREMGPGSRRDTLDYNFGDYNWKKILRLDKYLLRRMTAVTQEAPEHVIAYRELEEVIGRDLLAEWKVAVEAWERDPTQSNPFELRVSTPTQAAIRREIAEEHAKKVQSGEDVWAGKKSTPLGLLTKGFEIEKAQRELKKVAAELWDHSQDRALLRMRLKSDALILKIEDHYQTLESYIPIVAELRQNTESSTIPPYNLPLWLPSEIGVQAPFDLELGRLEFKLREAQAHEALGRLCRNLQRRATQYDSKDRWARGQGMNTHSLASISSLQDDIDEAAEEYRKAHGALTTLSTILSQDVHPTLLELKKQDIRSVPVQNAQDEVQKTIDLTRKLHPLEDGDLRAIDEPEEGRGTTQRTISWIWRQGKISAESDSYTVDLNRVEWAKSRARAARYNEEIDLLKEEMARTLRFMWWKSTWWREKASGHDERGLSSAVVEGMSAYSLRQADMWEQRYISFAKAWEPVEGLVKTARERMEDPVLFYQWKKAELERRERARK